MIQFMFLKDDSDCHVENGAKRKQIVVAARADDGVTE